MRLSSLRPVYLYLLTFLMMITLSHRLVVTLDLQIYMRNNA